MKHFLKTEPENPIFNAPADERATNANGSSHTCLEDVPTNDAHTHTHTNICACINACVNQYLFACDVCRFFRKRSYQYLNSEVKLKRNAAGAFHAENRFESCP